MAKHNLDRRQIIDHALQIPIDFIVQVVVDEIRQHPALVAQLSEIVVEFVRVGTCTQSLFYRCSFDLSLVRAERCNEERWLGVLDPVAVTYSEESCPLFFLRQIFVVLNDVESFVE